MNIWPKKRQKITCVLYSKTIASFKGVENCNFLNDRASNLSKFDENCNQKSIAKCLKVDIRTSFLFLRRP